MQNYTGRLPIFPSLSSLSDALLLAGATYEEDGLAPRLRLEGTRRPLFLWLKAMAEAHAVRMPPVDGYGEADGPLAFRTEPMPLLMEAARRWRDGVPGSCRWELLATRIVWVCSSFAADSDEPGLTMTGPALVPCLHWAAPRALLACGGHDHAWRRGRLCYGPAAKSNLRAWLAGHVPPLIWASPQQRIELARPAKVQPVRTAP
jgi:hypothetical protein